MDTLRFYEKQVYGVNRIYPMPEIKDAVKALTGRETVDTHHLKALRTLGFQVVVNKPNFEAVIY